MIYYFQLYVRDTTKSVLVTTQVLTNSMHLQNETYAILINDLGATQSSTKMRYGKMLQKRLSGLLGAEQIRIRQ